MENGIMNKIKSLFNRKKNENKNEEIKEEIKVEKQKHDSNKIEEKEIKASFKEKQTSRENHSNENKVKNSKKNYSYYESNKDKNKKTYNDKKSIDRKKHDDKSSNTKYNSNNGKMTIDKKKHISEIENLIKDITIGMEFVEDSFKGKILKKQSYNLIYSIDNEGKYALTYKELIEGYIQRRKSGSIDEKWYETNFNNNIGSSNLRMINAILKNT